jgi:hypothetical protein
MPIIDPATKLANAIVGLFNSDPALAGYNWQSWESDVDVEQPRGFVNVNFIAALVDAASANEFQVEVVFEGKPKVASPSDAVAEVIGHISRPDIAAVLQALITDGSITLYGKAQNMRLQHQITGDLRRRTVSFVIFGHWNVAYVV